MLFLMAERGSLSGGAFLHTVGYCKAISFITELGAWKRMGDEWMIRRGR